MSIILNPPDVDERELGGVDVNPPSSVDQEVRASRLPPLPDGAVDVTEQVLAQERLPSMPEGAHEVTPEQAARIYEAQRLQDRANQYNRVSKLWGAAASVARVFDFGEGLATAGQLTGAAAMDALGQFKGDQTDPIYHLKQAWNRKPIDQTGDPMWEQGVVQGARALPQVAAGMALASSGIPPALAFGAPAAVQTAHETGGNVGEAVKSGLTAAAIPGVGAESRAAASKGIAAMVQEGILSKNATTLQKAAEALAEQVGIQVYMEGMNIPTYLTLSPEQRKEELTKSIVANLAYLPLAAKHVWSGAPSDTQTQLKMREAYASNWDTVHEIIAPKENLVRDDGTTQHWNFEPLIHQIDQVVIDAATGQPVVDRPNFSLRQKRLGAGETSETEAPKAFDPEDPQQQRVIAEKLVSRMLGLPETRQLPAPEAPVTAKEGGSGTQKAPEALPPSGDTVPAIKTPVTPSKPSERTTSEGVKSKGTKSQDDLLSEQADRQPGEDPDEASLLDAADRYLAGEIVTKPEMVEARTKAPKALPAPTNPWEMTRAEWVASGRTAASHYPEVWKAIKRGEEVPDHVLNDYPNTKAQLSEARNKVDEVTKFVEDTSDKGALVLAQKILAKFRDQLAWTGDVDPSGVREGKDFSPLANDAVAHLWNQRRHYKPTKVTLDKWASTVLHNYYLDRTKTQEYNAQRVRASERPPGGEEEGTTVWDMLEHPDRTPEENAVFKELHNTVSEMTADPKVLASLPKHVRTRARKVLRMFTAGEHDLPNREIATRLDLSVETVRTTRQQIAEVFGRKLIAKGFDGDAYHNLRKLLSEQAERDLERHGDEMMDALLEQPKGKPVTVTPDQLVELRRAMLNNQAGRTERTMSSPNAEPGQAGIAKNLRKKGAMKKQAEAGFINAQILAQAAKFIGSLARKGMGKAAAASTMVQLFGRKILRYIDGAWHLAQRVMGIKPPATPPASLPPGAPHIPSSQHSMFRIPRNWGGFAYLRKVGLDGLATAIRKWEDRMHVYHNMFSSEMDKLKRALTSSQVAKGLTEATEYLRLREQGYHSAAQRATNIAAANRFAAGASPEGKRVIEFFRNTGRITGMVAQRLGIQVQDGRGWRPMVNMAEEHYPRRFSEDFRRIVSNPAKHEAEYRQLLSEMVANGNAATEAEADAMLNKTRQHYVEGDHFANAEVARGLKLPDKYYDISPDGYLQFLSRFAERAAQIEAFGQKTTPDTKDAFDIARETGTRDESLKSYISDLEATIKRSGEKSFWKIAAHHEGRLTAVGFLTSPLTWVRNFNSTTNAAENLGFMRIGGATVSVLRDAVAASAKSFVDLAKGNTHTTTPKSVLWAEEIGAVQRDMASMQMWDVEANSPSLRDKTVRAAMWGQRTTERLSRAIAAVAAKTWARRAQQLYAANRDSHASRVNEVFLDNLGFTGSKLADFMANDLETVNGFIRAAVREKLYNYTSTQAPKHLDNQAARLILRFQKWGHQRTSDIDRNVIKPMFATVRGQRTINLMPLMRFTAGVLAQGEAYAALRGLLTGKDRKDASVEEITTTWSEDKERALLLLTERLAQDFVLGSGVGIVGDYAAALNPIKSNRWKSITEPPVFGLFSKVGDVFLRAYQRKGDLQGIGDDIVEALSSLPLGTMVKGVAAQVAPGLDSSHNTANSNLIRNIRNLSLRYSEEYGLNTKTSSAGPFPKNENTSTYERLAQAMMRGDREEAKALVRGFTRNMKDMDALDKVSSAMRSRQPLNGYGVDDDQTREQFLKWVKRRVPSQYEAIKNLDRTYRRTGIRVGVL